MKTKKGYYKYNKLVEGKIIDIKDYGIFLMLENNFLGLIQTSHISDIYKKDIYDYKICDIYMIARVIGYNKKKNIVYLSINEFNGNNYYIKEKIIETKSGFDSLNKNIYKWINEKMDEINNIK